jgi:tetratricopeptide (TPR) repeat protein
MRTLALAVVLLTTFLARGQKESDWRGLLDAKKFDQVNVLCTGWTASKTIATRVEAEKCLANLALARGPSVAILGNETGGGTLGDSASPDAVSAAVIHLKRAISLAPQDLTIHQGRLYVLESAGRFDEMCTALDESAAIYKGPDALQAWMAYDFELADMGQLRAGLKFAEVLDLHYPNSHDVIGNTGTFHSMLKEYKEALPYQRRAVQLAPEDPLDAWNLGRTFAELGQTANADLWMSKGIALDPSGKQMLDAKCFYADFVATKLQQPERACQLEKASCAPDRQTACERSSQPARPQPVPQILVPPE